MPLWNLDFNAMHTNSMAKDKVVRVRTAGDVPKRQLSPALGVSIESFRKTVWKYYKENGRHTLPWRHTRDPYKILVSEVMLQQTQVSRVMSKYKEFLEAFPTVETLARAKLSEVLKVWSGLGYNRRGKYLRDAAVVIIKHHKGKVPRDVVTLRTLPGIGPYTASALSIFTFNTPLTLIETNVRSVFIHHFFTHIAAKSAYGGQTSVVNVQRLSPNISILPLRRPDLRKDGSVSDRELLPLIEKAAEGQDPRKWHWALMDYGAYLKTQYANPSRRSAHHAKQSTFEGSLRQIRGAILRELHQGRTSVKGLQFSKERVEKALAGLVRDEMIKKEKGKWRIA